MIDSRNLRAEVSVNKFTKQQKVSQIIQSYSC